MADAGMAAMASSLGMDNLSAEQQMQVMQATSAILDRAVEAENQKLDEVLNDEDALAKMRKKRIEQMKQEQAMRSKWVNKGHGKLGELDDQKDFFKAVEGSERVVAVFTTPTNKYGVTLCEHMEYVASKHMETRFIKLDAEKSPFLVEKLKVWMIPSTILIKNEKAIHTIQGLDELGTSGDFESWHLERLLHNYEMLTHNDIEEKSREDDLDDNDDY